MKKSQLLLIVSIVLAVALSVGGTLAYLTDTDEDVNVMTLGNVDIEQIELQRAPGVAYNATAKEGDLVPFVEGQPLYPAYPKADAVNPYTAAPNDDLFNWGPYVYTGTAGNGLFNDEKLTGALDKFVFVKNTGTSDAYFRTWLAFECPESLEYDGDEVKDLWINATSSQKYQWIGEEYLTIEGTRYLVMCAVYQDALAPGNTSHPSLLQVALSHKTDNEDMEALGETYEILAFTEAVQTKNLESIGASQALEIAFDKDGDGVATINDHPWQDGVEGLPTKTVSTAAELEAALAEGGIVVLANDIEVNKELQIAAGKKVDLILGDNTLTIKRAEGATHVDGILVKGELTVNGGTVDYVFTGENMGWNGGANAIDVTAGGVLNLNCVTVKSSGTDMNFCVHLNNWGKVTLNAENCVFDSTYCGVRVFNSGFDMNNITIKNSTLKGATRAFWVHNYIGDLSDPRHTDEAIAARLNLDIYNNNNVFDISGTATTPIRYGFNNTVYYNADGTIAE